MQPYLDVMMNTVQYKPAFILFYIGEKEFV